MATGGVVRILCVLLAVGAFGSMLAEGREGRRYDWSFPTLMVQASILALSQGRLLPQTGRRQHTAAINARPAWP